MGVRIWAAAIGLSVFAILHATSAVTWARAGLPVGMWMTLAVYAAGDITAAYGLVRRRYWARCVALAIGIVAVTQIASMGLLAIASDTQFHLWGIVQFVVCGVLVGLMSGTNMRLAFEERPGNPWNFESRLAGVTRAAIVTGIGAVPMLFWMAANAVHATEDLWRVLAAVAGAAIVIALVIVVQGRTIGLLALAASALLGAVSAVMTVVTLDTNPSLAGQAAYWGRTVGAAVALTPGVVLGGITFAAFIPKMLRFVRAEPAEA